MLNKRKGKIMKKCFNVLVVMIVCCMLSSAFTSCESCSRDMKSLKSDFGGGLYRTAVLMDYNGDTIKTWSGKFDIRDSGSDNQIFFDIDGKRVWIQGGIFVRKEK